MDTPESSEPCMGADAAEPQTLASAQKNEDSPPRSGRTLTEPQRQRVREQLEHIVASPAFRSSPRSKEFLLHIVERVLHGQEDCLKERSIGADVFHRPADYLTGDDPVVRVTAREVRRRLTRYYAEAEAGSDAVRIDLPVGSYKPEFHWASVQHADTPDSPEAVPEADNVPAIAPPYPIKPASRRPRWALRWPSGLGAGLAILLLGWFWLARSALAPTQPADQFWQPMLASAQPVLVCLDSPVAYQPSLSLYQRYDGPDAARYATEAERIHNVLQLPPHTPLQWQDLQAYSDFYVANGDAYAAARFSALFAGLKKSSELHIGNGCSYQDLRYNPAVLVGAFNNRWTLQFTSQLPFRFAEQNNQGRVESTADPSQRWPQHWDLQGKLDRDYGVISRLFDSETGQMVIIVAGIGPEGTQAASDLVSSPKELSRALESAPAGWASDDLQMVISTPITDGMPGKPSVVASQFWPAH